MKWNDRKITMKRAFWIFLIPWNPLKLRFTLCHKCELCMITWHFCCHKLLFKKLRKKIRAKEKLIFENKQLRLITKQSEEKRKWSTERCSNFLMNHHRSTCVFSLSLMKQVIWTWKIGRKGKEKREKERKRWKGDEHLCTKIYYKGHLGIQCKKCE